MDSRLSWTRTARWSVTIAGIVAALAVLVSPAAAWALEDPPDVTGASLDEAREALTAWDDSVIILVEQGPRLVAGQVDESTVVVVRSQWLNPVTIDPEPPRIALTLGTAIPDLTGLTGDEARSALARRGLAARPNPPEAEVGWVVQNQRPAEGTLVSLGSDVFIFLEPAPAESREAPLPRDETDGGLSPRVLAIGGGALVAVLVIMATALALRGRRRRYSAAYPVARTTGGLGAPEPTESQPAPGVTVTLVPRADPGTLTVAERRR